MVDPQDEDIILAVFGIVAGTLGAFLYSENFTEPKNNNYAPPAIRISYEGDRGDTKQKVKIEMRESSSGLVEKIPAEAGEIGNSR